jgi:hypothetical protein
LISFRSDYGSTWEGDVVIRNCTWIPACGDTAWPYMFGVRNDGMHDFGYPCSMPRDITIDGLYVDDANHPEDYEGMAFFTDPDSPYADGEAITLPADRPFPYEHSQKVRVRGLVIASGKRPQISPNAEMRQDIVVIEET